MPARFWNTCTAKGIYLLVWIPILTLQHRTMLVIHTTIFHCSCVSFKAAVRGGSTVLGKAFQVLSSILILTDPAISSVGGKVQALIQERGSCGCFEIKIDLLGDIIMELPHNIWPEISEQEKYLQSSHALFFISQINCIWRNSALWNNLHLHN